MRQGINLGFVLKKRNAPDRSPGEAVALCRDAGFSIVDYLTPVVEEDWREQAEAARELMDSCGVEVHQAHCPFFRYKEGGLKLFAEYAPRAVRAASILGAEFFVIHADEYREPDSFDFERILRKTREYLAPVVDLCAQAGIRPAIENLFEDGFETPTGGRSRFTSKTEEVIAVIESFPGSGIGCCWDSGHAQCAYGEHCIDELEKLAPYVTCTHMHDNSYGVDQHKLAFFGNLNWERVMEILKNAGYPGEFTWEFVYERFPDVLLPDFLRLAHKTGEYLIHSISGESGKVR